MKKILLLSIGVLIFSQAVALAGEGTSYSAKLGNTISAKEAGNSDTSTVGSAVSASSQSAGLGSTVSDKQ